MEQAVDRLERFRALRAKLDPAGNPARALSDGSYVERTGSVSARLVAELALAPTSTHLLIGGVGSGKTTELLRAQSRLDQIPDTRAFYVDVSKGHDITKMVPGAVAVQVGLALSAWVQTNDASNAQAAGRALKRLRDIAHGYYERIEIYDPTPEDLGFVPGILVPPEEEKVQEILTPIALLLNLIRAKWMHAIVLLDGLDRLADMAALEQIVDHDINALQSLGLGVVLIGPLRALYGMARTLEQRFNNFHYQPWIDPSSGTSAKELLITVLQKRIPSDAMDQQGLEALVRNSGGVLRDLLALAQSACLEAYLNGANVLGLWEADTAIDAFGRKHMQGLRPADLEVLQRVHQTGNFVHTSEDELALLMTRRVLEYRINGRPRYAVHPTIVPFLQERAGDAA
ncbi:hypothetical protein [Polyangium spumosum]|uniref:AAA family ATPase n=1 Tax=Polyangium spumosum TaxID=889282 RepID=A0A6N7PS00_9BACT|nr:hypothetical protein [Polyangium spumosum]MRG94773.1 hypothetical protein [Polyangium spumosum]